MIENKYHILVVDDDEGIRSLVKKYLDQNNFITSTAKDAKDAYEKTKLVKFDLTSFVTPLTESFKTWL